MAGINKVILVGRVGKQPEIRYAANGNAIATFSLATSEKYTNKQTGQKQETTDWHQVVIFGKLANVVENYVNKGDMLYLEGKVKTRKWQDQNTGQDRYTTEIVLDFNGVMQMLGGGNGDNQQNQGGYQQPQQPKTKPKNNAYAQAQNGNYTPPQNQQPNDFNDDNVPF